MKLCSMKFCGCVCVFVISSVKVCLSVLCIVLVIGLLRWWLMNYLGSSFILWCRNVLLNGGSMLGFDVSWKWISVLSVVCISGCVVVGLVGLSIEMYDVWLRLVMSMKFVLKL